MEIRYYRDSSHNYLVLDRGDESAGEYQYRMLENNRIEGVIPFSIRSVNKVESFYYEIDSRLSLENKYCSKKMTYEKLTAFIRSFTETADRLGEYFLDDDRLIMRKDCIFEDLSTGEFSFLYYPDDVGQSTDSFSELLLELADMSDEKTSEFVYRVCENVSGNTSGLSLFLKDIIRNEISAVNIDVEENYELKWREDDVCEEETDEEYVEKRVIKIRIPSLASFFLAVLFALVAGALWYIRLAYILTPEENILDIAIFMGSVLMSLICLLQGVKHKKAKPLIDPDYVDDEDRETEEYPVQDENDTDTWDNEDKVKVYENERSMAEDFDEENEETVFLNMDFEHATRKLYREDGGRGQNISLEKLPLTIGKLSEYADAVLRDPTVSRIHARIIRTGDDYFVQDLNSRNGTYVNGKRLLPNEKFMLFPEDEVAFGKCTFSYR